jgi:hypothetical protein
MYKGFEIELVGDSPNEYIARENGRCLVFACPTIKKVKQEIDKIVEFRKKKNE